MQKRHTTLKNGWETAETLRNHGVYSIGTKNLNNLNKTCWQKVRKIYKHTHSDLLQIDDGNEDENTIVDQTVSINTILLYWYFWWFLQLLLKQILPIGIELIDMFLCVQGGYGQLSEYELKRLETIRENQAFLSSINLLEVMMLLKPICPEIFW